MNSQPMSHLMPAVEAPISLQKPIDHQGQRGPTDHQISQELYRRLGKNDGTFQQQSGGDGSEYLTHKPPSTSLIKQLIGSMRDVGSSPNEYDDATLRRGLTLNDIGSHLNQYHEPEIWRAEAPDDSFLLTAASFFETEMHERSLNDENEQRNIYDHLAEHRERMDLLYTLRKARHIASLTSSQDEQQILDSIDENQDNDADDLIFEIEL